MSDKLQNECSPAVAEALTRQSVVLRAAREALEKSNAAMWDSHYGSGIVVEYAQSRDRLVKAALAAIDECLSHE